MQDEIKDNNSLIAGEKGSSEIKIKKIEGKECIDKRFGMPLEEKTAPKYYFEKNGERISRDYYSIEQLDEVHYVVSDLDFMYSLGFSEWENIYRNEFSDGDYYRFKFHKGIVAVIEGNVIEIIPTIYKDLKLKNSNIVFTKGDPIYKTVGFPVRTIRLKDKIGCINLDLNSEYYGWTIFPIIFDSIMNFDLEFEGFAHATIGEYEGYISKEIDIDRYKEYAFVLAQFKNKVIDYKTYQKHLEELVSKILLTKEEVIDLINGANKNGCSKKIGELPNKKNK